MLEDSDLPEGPGPAQRMPLFMGLIVFGFGTAAGFLLAFSGYGLEESAGLIIAVFLVLIFCVLVLGLILIAFRKPLMTRAFGVAGARLEELSGPLADVARSAAERDALGATDAARMLLRMSMARYAWMSTRRWLIASLTGLIAAMAALTGTALLFRQNQLIEAEYTLLTEQTGLLREQNARVSEQTDLLRQQVELAEAARNAELAVEITNIAALLGEALEATGDTGLIPVLDAQTDIGHALRLRIIAASRGAKPYRYLAQTLFSEDNTGKLREAAARRRADLPGFYDGAQAAFRWVEPSGLPDLIDRPASPERGQLLEVMIQSGLRELESLTYYGLDLSFAVLPDARLFAMSLQGGRLAYSVMPRAQVIETDFRGAAMENSDFSASYIRGADFGPLTPEVGKGPYAQIGLTAATQIAGASFADGFLQDVRFAQVQALAANFDRATLQGVSFAGAILGGATFRDAVLMNVDFNDAAVHSVDFDGAFVFAADTLAQWSDVTAKGSFRADRYVLEPATAQDVMQIDSAYQQIAPEDLGPVWRIRRVKPFEDQAE
ncbi:pentapeptide repeat-containing protein [Pseudoprimorskyibacter insulae]|uniref:Pentapeptide repeat-containing protein n=1 Tax=Pseudoprimorskyibacter insulae TaxID=1695997 RepID=A0A2R8AP28_9RHOB|nr:pentapeptide repeat-containing protein [Pseudoprimorskyibacter insulae]SPF77801.1 hypothetical protein PRI8871_00387 [Pseudoprimorskyibacter insulae]